MNRIGTLLVQACAAIAGAIFSASIVDRLSQISRTRLCAAFQPAQASTEPRKAENAAAPAQSGPRDASLLGQFSINRSMQFSEGEICNFRSRKPWPKSPAQSRSYYGSQGECALFRSGLSLSSARAHYLESKPRERHSLPGFLSTTYIFAANFRFRRLVPGAAPNCCKRRYP